MNGKHTWFQAIFTRIFVGVVATAVAIGVSSLSFAKEEDLTKGMKEGTPNLQSAGALAFAPQGILLVGDAQASTVFAIDTGDAAGSAKAPVNVENLGKKVADLLGVTERDVLINDLAVNPASGKVYLSVSRGRGPDATPVILKVNKEGKISELSLKKVKFSKAALSNTPEAGAKDRRGQSLRSQSITDLAYVDGRVFVAGLSTEEFASNLRALSFPFDDTNSGAGIRIFHGAHGRFETQSPVRTFTSYKINGEQNLLCAYTCTPLVKIPVSQLKAGEKVQGVTVAELGNRNRPLDMFVYNKNGNDYILIANSSRGVMKVTTNKIGEIEGITDRISGTAGLKYDTIEDLQGVMELDQLNEESAVALLRTEDGGLHLKTIDLP